MDADGSSLLRHALSLGAGRPRPSVPCVVDGDRVRGEAIVVGVGGVGAQGHIRKNSVYRVPHKIEVGKRGCARRERKSGALSFSDDNALAEELFFVFGSHWNERENEKE